MCQSYGEIRTNEGLWRAQSCFKHREGDVCLTAKGITRTRAHTNLGTERLAKREVYSATEIRKASQQARIP